MKVVTLFATVFASKLSLAASSSIYSCKVDATFEVDDDPDNPLLPTSTEENWASSRVKTSYNDVHLQHNDDFNMDSESFDSFSYGQVRRADEKDITTALRGGKNLEGYNLIRWYHRYKTFAQVSCTFCSNWDDDDALQANINLEGTVNHDRWVAAWCDELQQGPYLVFEYAESCTLELYDCTTYEGDRDEDAGNNVILNLDEIVANVSPIVVGSEMKTIETEAEVAAQEVHED